jgi:hypothetical protein
MCIAFYTQNTFRCPTCNIKIDNDGIFYNNRKPGIHDFNINDHPLFYPDNNGYFPGEIIYSIIEMAEFPDYISVSCKKCLKKMRKS